MTSTTNHKSRRTAFIDVDDIEAVDRLRSVLPADVDRLAASMAEIGLRTPISVRYYEERPEALPYSEVSNALLLVTGAHRVAAARKLGWEKIEAFVFFEGDADDIRLWEIDENLCRNDLSATDRARHTAARKEIFERRNGPSKAIGARAANAAMGNAHDANDNLALAFTAETAAATGQSQRTVQRDAERGQKVIPEVLNLVAGSKLDNGAYLDKLKRLPPNEQMTAAKRDLAVIRQRGMEADQQARQNKIDADVKARAAKEIAEIIVEYVPAEWWDAVKSNLYATSTKSVADALTNLTGASNRAA
ncbi:hypothetical protein DEM27_28575 [Metarhizobium album]|uniref:ParB-like N-terminal domain-containing protein n=1 Tax=Metarhizobium album TaxID=2182425 RepID=A0A2U2DHG8_9HYPH|nr:ParB N-terminal domain-containing protein [Rhizobium album]PWE52763.1 hypothetical protein DEM27_28575 [Rhizobium album]